MCRHVQFLLTDDQLKAIKPIFDEMRKAFKSDKPGSVFLQAYEDGECSGEFIPREWAAAIFGILKVYHTDDAEETLEEP